MIVRKAEDFVRVIRQQRSRQHMTNEQLADRAGISPYTLHTALYDPRITPRITTILPLMHALGLEIAIVRRKPDGSD